MDYQCNLAWIVEAISFTLDDIDGVSWRDILVRDVTPLWMRPYYPCVIDITLYYGSYR